MRHNHNNSWLTVSRLYVQHKHTHTHPFNGPLFRTTQVSWYQKGKTNLVFTEARDSGGSGISWAICKSAPRSRQINAPAPHNSIFTDRMPFRPPNQQRQSTEGILYVQLDTKFRRRSSQPISWLVLNKLNQTQQKQTCIHNKIYYNIKWTQKLKPGFAAFYEPWPGNGMGLFLNK